MKIGAQIYLEVATIRSQPCEAPVKVAWLDEGKSG